MEKYIGTKLVEAEEMSRGEHSEWMKKRCEGAAEGHCAFDANEAGYSVKYPDGYVSWSPKEIFEKAYLKMSVNEKLKTDKHSISPQMVDDFISQVHVTTMGDKCTVVRAVLRNGFEIVEASACVSAENYDEKLGAEICLKKIKDKIWFLLGFLLQTAVHGI